jgi:hypothetical protein
MIAASILVLAAVLYIMLRRVAVAILYFCHVVEKALNISASRNGQPPVTTPEDAKPFL